MATISLYSSKINQMPGMLKTSQSKVNSLQDDLKSLNKRILKVDNSACDVYNEAGLIQASVNTQELLSESLGKLKDDFEEFIIETAAIDNSVASLINQKKNEFYEKYSYLKPESEKSIWEKVKDTYKKSWEWCREHWKLILTIKLVIAAIAIIVFCPAAGIGLLVLGAAKGLLAGAAIGGIISGIASKASGKSFLEGFEDGAFSGALMGALFGGIGGAGELAGLKFGESCVRIGKYLETIQKVTLSANIINLGLAGFDTITLAASLFAPDCKLVQINQTLHSSKLYNAAQLIIGGIGAFGGGMLKGIKYDMANGISKCFIAGTLISTVSGLVAIENIKAGDMVLSTDVKTGITEFKKVVETYVRETMKLVHLKVNGEEIVTTEGHPFYMNDIGFVNACELSVGDKLTDSDGKVMFIESVNTEVTDEAVKVYNFQVEDTHTYYVSDECILVHNASYTDRGIELPDYIKRDLEKLKNKGDYIIGSEDNFNMMDVSIMSKETGVEFARVSLEEKTYLIRGDELGTTIPDDLINKMMQKGGSFDFHSHPFDDALTPSSGDKMLMHILRESTGQETSLIVTPNGKTALYNEYGIIEVGIVENNISDGFKNDLLYLFGGL